MNIIGTLEEFPKSINCLKKLFEMKNLGKTMSLQGEYLDNGIFVHQEGYIERVIKHFDMDISRMLYSISVKIFKYGEISYVDYPNDVRSLDKQKIL